MKLFTTFSLISTINSLDLIVKLGEDRGKCRRPFIDQKEFVTSKRGKIIDKHNLHSCCSFKSFQRRDDDRCFGQVIRTFSYDSTDKDCYPVNIRALCQDEANFSKMNLFRSRNKCTQTCMSSQSDNNGRRTEPHSNSQREPQPHRPSLLDRDRNRESLMSELGIGPAVAPAAPQNPFSMFAPPMTGRSVFGADPNRAGHDEYFNRLREMHQRGGTRSDEFQLDAVVFDVDTTLDDGRPKLCRKQMKRGKLDGDLPAQLKWYYNIDTNTCSEFYFNGKGGNENQFDSHAQCMSTCYIESVESEENATMIERNEKTARAFKSKIGEYGFKELLVADLCSMPPPTSFCNTQSVSSVYYYNMDTASCEVFLLGDCGTACAPGQCNRFTTLDDCNYYCA